jgi:hypothetical protein
MAPSVIAADTQNFKRAGWSPRRHQTGEDVVRVSGSASSASVVDITRLAGMSKERTGITTAVGAAPFHQLSMVFTKTAG